MILPPLHSKLYPILSLSSWASPEFLWHKFNPSLLAPPKPPPSSRAPTEHLSSSLLNSVNHEVLLWLLASPSFWLPISESQAHCEGMTYLLYLKPCLRFLLHHELHPSIFSFYREIEWVASYFHDSLFKHKILKIGFQDTSLSRIVVRPNK